MTVETERVRPLDEDPAGPASVGADRTALIHIRVGAALLALGALLWAVTFLQLVWPGLLGGLAFLSYGRLLPAAVAVALFGGVGVAFIGVVYLIVSRSTGLPVWGGGVPMVALALVVGGVLAGAAAVLFGMTEGRELAELPLWADLAVAAGLLGAAYTASRSADLVAERVTPPAVWFALGALWWAGLAYVAGNVPGLAGVNGAIQTAFANGALLLGAIPAVVVAILYHTAAGLPVPLPEPGDSDAEPEPVVAAAEDPEQDPDQLARLGFWSLFFVSGWVGARFLVHSPAPDWLETIGVVFSITYLVPVLVIVTDLVRRVRGAWAGLRGDTGIRFLAAALGAWALLAVVSVAHSLRGAAALTNLTFWGPAFLLLAVFGCAGLALAGLLHRLRGSGRAGAGHLALALGGLGLLLVALWAAGLQQSLTWVAAANTPELPAAGIAFAAAVEPLEAWLVLAAVGAVVLVAAQVLLAMAAGGVTPGPVETDSELEPVAGEEPAVDEEGLAAPLGLKVVVQGAIGLFVVAALAVMVVPTFEQDHRDASLLAEARNFADGTPEAEGRAIYLAEGCMYCHTQQVRRIVTDVGLGPVALASDYAGSTPSLLGVARIGPDLMHSGSRENTDSVRWLRDHLADPQAERPWSIMPSYDHLSAADLQALAQYLTALR